MHCDRGILNLNHKVMLCDRGILYDRGILRNTYIRSM